MGDGGNQTRVSAFKRIQPWRREDMNRIVEAVIKRGDLRVPVGLISIKQALDLPLREGFEFSHPAYEAGKTDVFIDREMLLKLK
jgi:hypothetical protein